MNTLRLPFRFLLLAAVFVLILAVHPAPAGIIEEFLFNDPNGTPIDNTVNNINPTHTWDTDTQGDTDDVTTNGAGQLNASLKANTGFGTNYVDVDPLTTGRYYGVMELTWDFQSTLDTAENEEVRISLINNDPRGTEITAEWYIQRTDDDEVVIFGNALGTGSSGATGNTVLSGGGLTQSTKFIAVVDADLDTDKFEIFYSDDAGSSFQSAGTGDLSPARGIESLRMTLNNDLSNDNVLIDRVYLTDVNPVTPVQKLKIVVNTTTGDVSIANDTGSTFDIDWYRITSSDDSLEYDNWDSLSDQGYDAIDGGDDVGETWDEAGGSDDGVLSESFLLGSSEFTPSESVSLGDIFKNGGTQGSLEFQYRDAVSENVFIGNIEFVEGLLGDYNENDVLDAADYTVWREALEANAAIPNDPTGGVATEADFEYWRDHFGESIGSGSGAGSASAVPEPTSLLLVLFGGLCTCILNPRNRRSVQ